MSVDLVLKNGFTVSTGQELVRSIAIEKGKIEGIYRQGEEPESTRIIDCDGQYVLPGFIDIHVHLRGLLQEEKEDYETGTRAAAAGGITTVIDMPNSSPPVLDMQVLQQKVNEAREHRYTNIGFYAGISKTPEEMSDDLFRNVLGLKVYPHRPLDDVTYDNARIRQCLKVAKNHGLPLMFHPDSTPPDRDANSMDEYFEIHSCESEVRSLEQFLEANRNLDCRLHVCHVSCASTVGVISDNRQEDLLTAEATPHHLFLSRDSFNMDDGTAKMLPPLRSQEDCNVLKEALSRCQIDIVASDHAPHTSAEKEASFKDAKAGIPGLETLTPVLLTEVFNENLSWVELLRLGCSGPASILRIAGKGVLSKGYDADIAIFSREDWVIRGEEFQSKAKRTPFEGYVAKAKPVTTIVGGEVVFNDGEFEVPPGIAGAVPIRNVMKPVNT
jgi:dihydroorotase (multifunctional complex type)